MITKKILEELKPGIFAFGVCENSIDGIFADRTGGLINWVAVRGDTADWAIYYARYGTPVVFIEQEGDKLFNDEVVRKLVPCDGEAFGVYRK